MTPNPLDPTLDELNACGCCQGTEVRTPRALEPRPGWPAIPFRAGTHADFLATLLAGLSNAEWLRQRLVDAGLIPADNAEAPALTRLTTRSADDFTIGLLDGFAAMADVLTFYSERIANEAFLRTATERRSVLWLARAIGYELKPGVAASTWLAFNIESAPGAPGWSTILPGTKVQSVPGPGQKPQTYETLADLEARAEWNELRPRSREFVTPFLGQREIHLAGTATNLKPGDTLLIIGQERRQDVTGERWDFRRVKAVTFVSDADPSRTFTIIALDEPLGTFVPRRVSPSTVEPRVYALRLRARLFGHGAPEWLTLPDDVRGRYVTDATRPISETDWPGFTIHAVAGADPTKTKAAICLDSTYGTIAKDSWIVLATTAYQEAYRVTSVREDAPRKFTLTHQVTRLGLEEGHVPENLAVKFNAKLRETTVFGQSEELPWAEVPFFRPVAGNRVTLDRRVEGLPEGRGVVFQGRRARLRVKDESQTMHLASGSTRRLSPATVVSLRTVPAWATGAGGAPDLDTDFSWQIETSDGAVGWIAAPAREFVFLPADPQGPLLVETATIRRTFDEAGRTVLELGANLAHAYDPASLTIFANVAYATHGESVSEILGHGEATRAHQQFGLRQAPLTFVPAANETGRETSLQVWINDVRWHEVGSLYGQEPRARVYVARRADDGATQISFGDGEFGARLPTGRENVRAVYRKGIGIEGLVDAGQLSLLVSRPLGVKAVANPAPSSGAEDPEPLEDARRNAPLQTLTLGRVVSLGDYRDFARAFAGVARAHAAWTWTSAGRGVFLTVLGPMGAALPEGPGTTIEKLQKALLALGNPLVPLTVKSGTLSAFRIGGTIHGEADRVGEQVLAAVQAGLRRAFAFAARDFGQPIARSEILAVMHRAPGIAFVDLDVLHRAGEPAAPNEFIEAARPRDGSAQDQAQPAELLMLDETSLTQLLLRRP